MSEKKDFEVYRGDSRRITVNFSENATPVITGGTVWMTVKEKKADPDEKAVITKTVPITVTDGKGQAVINLTPTDTEIAAKKYYQDIQLVSADKSVVKTLIDGAFRILVDITRSI